MTSLSDASFGMTIQISLRVGRLSDRLMSDEIYNNPCEMGD
jgi:hypothetical protein